MNGKELFKGLSHIDRKYIDEAEFAAMEATASRKLFRRPLLVAAIIALTLLLVGCGIVYVLSMQRLKIGETTQEQYVFATDGISIIGTQTVEQNVLTLAGLEGSATYKANAEWYAYQSELLDSINKMGEAGELPEDYWQSGAYQKDIEEKADELAAQYGLKPEGKKLEFRTTRNLCDALGVERFQTTAEAVAVSVKDGGCYDNGNFWMNIDFSFRDGQTYDVSSTWGVLRWNRTDAFSRDYILLNETGDWKEWNYTTSSGNEVLILCSPSDWRGYILCDRGEALMSLQVEYRVDLGYNVDGKSWWDYLYMTDRQMELVADSIDFSIQPKVATQEDVDNQAAISASATQNGYTLTLKSVETDGYVARILVGVTAPEGVDIESLNIGTGGPFVEFEPAGEKNASSGGGAFNSVSDGDGKANTKDLLMETIRSYADGSMPFAPGSVWNLHIVDLWVDKYMGSERLLTEGEWLFPITFDETNGDYREVELIQEPVSTVAAGGMYMDGTDEEMPVKITSFKLRKFSVSIVHDGESYCSFSWINGKQMLVVMKDGTEIPFAMNSGNYSADETIDLEEVDHILLPDGTKLPMPEK